MIGVEAAQGTVKGIEGVTVEIGTSGKVTEVEECRDALDNVRMHKTMNSRQVYLVFLMRKMIENKRMNAHLHKSLRIVSSPLLKPAALFESS